MAHNEPITIRLSDRRRGNIPKLCAQSVIFSANNPNFDAIGDMLPLPRFTRLSPTKEGSSE